MQQPSEGRHSARHSRSSRDMRQASRAARRDASRALAVSSRPRNTAAAWYRCFAVLAIVALVAVAFAYRGQIWRARLTSSSATVPLLGSSVLSMPDLGTDTSDFGRMPIVRVYYPGLPNPNAWSTGLAAANHSAVIVSFKALPTDILSGADDSALKHFFDTAPTGHPIYYTYYHEPEDNIERGEFKLADYKAAWAHVVAIANAAHNPELHSTLILMSWDLDKASHRNWKDYLPGGGIISTLGWDAYPVGSATNVNPQLTSPTAFMGPAIAAAKSVGLPYGFPEFGLSTANGRPGWLKEVGKYIMKSGALFASYFDGNQQYPTLRLTDAASISVWKSFVTASRNGGPTPNPSPSKSPSPIAVTDYAAGHPRDRPDAEPGDGQSQFRGRRGAVVQPVAAGRRHRLRSRLERHGAADRGQAGPSGRRGEAQVPRLPAAQPPPHGRQLHGPGRSQQFQRQFHCHGAAHDHAMTGPAI